MTINKRIYWISFIRLIALISIIFAHFTSNAFFPDNLYPINNFIYYFKTFGVFAFFFLSGFLYKRSKGDTSLFWKKKLLTVILPFFVASLFIFFYNLIKYRNPDLSSFLGLIGFGNYLWYIPVLLIIFAFFKISDKTWFDIMMILISIIFVIVTSLGLIEKLPFEIDGRLYYFIFPLYFGFFALGRLIRKYNVYELINKPTAIVSIVLLTAFLIGILFVQQIKTHYWTIFGHVISLVFLYYFICISKLFSGKFFDDYCAPYVYTVYLYHMMPYQFVLLRIPYYLSIPWTLVFVALFILILHLLRLLSNKVKFIKYLLLIVGVRA